MKNNQPSDTYKLLYNNIIDDLLFQICKTAKYCVNSDPENPIRFVIWEKFEEYRAIALRNMSGTRLDRHKIASCLCGSIIEVRPLIPITNKYHKNVNEILALEVGINVIKYFMMCELLLDIKDNIHRQKSLRHLKEKFQMKFPPMDKNICDTQNYKDNLYNSLYWSHHKCDIYNKECFRYDIWAYAQLFYHLELYNKKFLNEAYQAFIKEQEN